MRRGWHSMTDDQWDALTAERSIAPPDQQGDLFDAELPLAAATEPRASAAKKPETDAAKRLLNVLRPDAD